MDFRPIASGCATLSPSARTSITAVWVPLRHAYWAASLNAAGLSSHSIRRPQPHGIELSDRHLRHAYFFSALGWTLGGAAALRSAQDIWLKHDRWQGVRRYTEDALALSDPLEGACALSLMLDGILRPQLSSDALCRCGGNEVEGLVSYFDGLIQPGTPAPFRAATTTVARWAPRAASAALPIFEQIWGRDADDKLGIAIEKLMIGISPDSDAVETNGA